MAAAKNLTLRALATASTPITSTDVAQLTGLSMSTQSTTLWRMRLDGFVDRNGKLFSLTERGKALADALPDSDDEEAPTEPDSEAPAPMDFAAWLSGDLTLFSAEADTTLLLSASEVHSLAEFIAQSPLRNIFAEALKAPHDRFATRDEMFDVATSLVAQFSAPPCPAAPEANKFGHLFTPTPGPAPTEPTGLVNPDSPV